MEQYASDTFVARHNNIAYLTPSLPQGTALIRILPEGTELKELIRILPQGIALKLLVLFSIVFYLKYIYVGFCKQFILRKGIHYTNWFLHGSIFEISFWGIAWSDSWNFAATTPSKFTSAENSVHHLKLVPGWMLIYSEWSRIPDWESTQIVGNASETTNSFETASLLCELLRPTIWHVPEWCFQWKGGRKQVYDGIWEQRFWTIKR